MSPNDCYDKANEYLRLILSHVGRNRIPVTPANYAVWYEYVAGSNHPLKTAIDEILISSGQFSDDINDELFEKYIVEKKILAGEKATLALQQILRLVSKYISESDGKISEHGATLGALAAQLQKENLDEDLLQIIIENVLNTTQKLLSRSTELDNNLQKTNQAISLLKDRLANEKIKATIDPLTGLANRRQFDKLLTKALDDTNHTGLDLSLLMLDIDHFKKVNDNHGHVVGDQVLRLCSSIIEKNIKGRDSAARYGGEEFVVILQDTPLKGALAVGEQIRSYFETRKWVKKDSGGTIGTITISIGASLYRKGESAESFIQRADKALYMSKNNGRNQVTGENG